MTVKISHQGMFNDGGTPFALAAGIKIGIHQTANFTHYKHLAKRTAVAGECDVCGAGDKAIGVFIDVSPQGDSCTVETKGYVWVEGYNGAAVGDLVTPDAAGKVKKATAPVGGAATLAELTTINAETKAGIWQVDAVNGTDVHINLG